jgi:dolichol-phosphate mannosyltransferase
VSTPAKALLGPRHIEHSVVVPVLNEEGNVRELIGRLVPVLEGAGQSFEVIVVDDGSTDGTPAILRELSEKEPRLRVLRLSRNYGQEAAVQAGMLRSRGRWVIQMDGDLQNPPEELPKLLAKRDEGHSIVYGIRTKRRDPWHRVAASKILVIGMRRVLGIELPPDVTTFRVIEGEVARFIAALPEKKKFFSALAVWTGAKSATVAVAHDARRAGATKYNLAKLINHTFDLMVGFSIRPLRIIGAAGALFAVLGIVVGVVRIAQKLLGADIAMGWTSIFSAVVIMGGLQLIALSVIGEYVARIFIQTQDRPLYRVSEELNAPEPVENASAVPAPAISAANAPAALTAAAPGTPIVPALRENARFGRS